MYDELLGKAYAASKRGKSVQEYNVFKVLEITEKEVLMCRILADFLNPQGHHKKGNAYLKIFLSEILHRGDANKICETAKVYKEYPIENDRRIDLVITAKDVFIPIEVKIHAGEQKAQCYDYFHHASMEDQKPQVVYLTIWGSEPGASSLTNKEGTDRLTADNYVCISFAGDIRKWLDLCIRAEEEEALKSILKQYKEAIENFAVFLDEETQMELVNTIMESEENFRGMLTISEVADRSKAKLMYQVFQEIEQNMAGLAGKFGLEKETSFNWYVYEEQANQEFYARRASTYPGINYLFKEIKLPHDIQMWLRIEVDHKLFFGLCLFDPHGDEGVGNQLDDPAEEIKRELHRYVKTESATYDAWWVKWWYLPTGTDQRNIDGDLVPDFKFMNEAAIKLSDAAYRKRFSEQAVKLMEDKLRQILL